jgi:hypothetical protein
VPDATVELRDRVEACVAEEEPLPQPHTISASSHVTAMSLLGRDRIDCL